jgi:hypothetical protein
VFTHCGLKSLDEESRLFAPEKNARGHGVGPLVWGRFRSSNLIFASTEPNDPQQKTGYHCYFDVTSGHRYALSAQNGSSLRDAADAIAINAAGR